MGSEFAVFERECANCSITISKHKSWTYYSYLHNKTLGLVVSARALLLLVFPPEVEDQSMEFLVDVWAWWAAM